MRVRAHAYTHTASWETEVMRAGQILKEESKKSVTSKGILESRFWNCLYKPTFFCNFLPYKWGVKKKPTAGRRGLIQSSVSLHLSSGSYPFEGLMTRLQSEAKRAGATSTLKQQRKKSGRKKQTSFKKWNSSWQLREVCGRLNQFMWQARRRNSVRIPLILKSFFIRTVGDWRENGLFESFLWICFWEWTKMIHFLRRQTSHRVFLFSKRSCDVDIRRNWLFRGDIPPPLPRKHPDDFNRKEKMHTGPKSGLFIFLWCFFHQRKQLFFSMLISIFFLKKIPHRATLHTQHSSPRPRPLHLLPPSTKMSLLWIKCVPDLVRLPLICGFLHCRIGDVLKCLTMFYTVTHPTIPPGGWQHGCKCLFV